LDATEAVVQMRDITKTFGTVVANDDVFLDIPAERFLLFSERMEAAKRR
jgi:ABC-type uncharacterized transport system ATPase subunit